MNNPKKIEVGDVFHLASDGTCIVIGKHDAGKILVEHQDENKHKALVDPYALKKGKVKNPYHPIIFGVGFFGVGAHRASIDGRMTPAYKVWRNMMKRSYCHEFHSEFPTYSGCSVEKEWHNFQRFADWYYNQNNNSVKGFEIDKDLLILGNKKYSEKTCTIIPRFINTILMDCAASRGEFPQGVSYSKEKRLYLAQIKIDGKTTYIGRFQSVDSAREAYEKVKARIVRESAEKYKEVLHPKVYENLKSWTLK